jgi:hypothetical protein
MDSIATSVCPVCGYELDFEPWRGESPSDEICPCCFIQFGYDDSTSGNLSERVNIYLHWRNEWIKAGMPWRGRGINPPENWNPEEQLQRVTDGDPSDWNLKVIDSQEKMGDFLKSIGYFHDALIREVGVINRGYVDPSGWMYGDLAPCDARLIFHSQYPEPACIEIIVEEVEVLKLEYYHVLDGEAEGVVTHDSITLLLGDSSTHESFMVSGKAMKYRILGREYLGKRPRTVEQIVEGKYE